MNSASIPSHGLSRRVLLSPRGVLIAGAATLAIGIGGAKAQTDLTAYTDGNGFLNVQALTCGQLANTWQQDADMLMAWYSGWYNGLAKKHDYYPSRSRELEHEVILHCKANQGIRVIDAIAVILKDERIRNGVEMK